MVKCYISMSNISVKFYQHRISWIKYAFNCVTDYIISGGIIENETAKAENDNGSDQDESGSGFPI